ncbi:hypothetical protein LXL04_004596 [Taraxacum kok-saghyz]
MFIFHSFTTRSNPTQKNPATCAPRADCTAPPSMQAATLPLISHSTRSTHPTSSILDVNGTEEEIQNVEIFTVKTPVQQETLEDYDTQLEDGGEDFKNGGETREIKVQAATPPPTPTPEKQGQPKKTTARDSGGGKKAAEGNEGKKRRKRRKVGENGGGEGHKRYLYRVMKQVHPDLGISSKAMTIIKNLMADMFEKLAEDAARLSDYNKKMAMTAREIQAAVKLVLPGELGKHAVAEGTKAVNNYVSYGGGKGGGRDCESESQAF